MLRTRDGDWSWLDELLIAQGVTTWAPTLVTAPLESFAAPLARIAEASARHGYVPRSQARTWRGPFSARCTAPTPPTWFGRRPRVAGGAARRGRDRDPRTGADAHAVDAIRLLRERDVLVALGHSAATFEESLAAVDAGRGWSRTASTACRRSTTARRARRRSTVGRPRGGVAHRRPGARAPDRDRHRVRAKGRGTGVALITDAVAWRAATVGEIAVHFDGRAPRLADGTLAGSALTMDQAVRNVVRHADVDLVDAVRAGGHDTRRPARARSTAAGWRRAAGDVVALDDGPAVEAVWVEGERARGSRERGRMRGGTA